MRIEDKLLQLIEEKYISRAEFCRATNIAESTLRTILKRGIANSNATSIFTIARALSLDTDALYDGKLVQRYKANKDLSLLLHEFEIRLERQQVQINEQDVSAEDLREFIENVHTARTKLEKNYSL